MSRTIPDRSLEARFSDLTKRVEALERRQPAAIAFGDATRIRVRVGKQDNGSFGIRVWNASGALVIDHTT